MATNKKNVITRKAQHEKYQHDKKYHAASDDYSQAVENRYSIRHFYGRRFEQQKQTAIIRLLNNAKISLKGKRIIDIGCHRGQIAGLWATLKGEASGVYGADFIQEYVATAQKINPGIKFIQHDVYDELPFKNGYFDLMSIVYVYACIPPNDQAEISARLATKISNTGLLILLDLNDTWLVRLRQRIITLLRRLRGRPGKAYLPRLNDPRVRELFPDFEIVESRVLMNMFSYNLLRYCPVLAKLADWLLPGEYYATMLKKREAR